MKDILMVIKEKTTTITRQEWTVAKGLIKNINVGNNMVKVRTLNFGCLSIL